ncbi:unnamed protein product [Lampetra fluviatilis]
MNLGHRVAGVWMDFERGQVMSVQPETVNGRATDYVATTPAPVQALSGSTAPQHRERWQRQGPSSSSGSTKTDEDDDAYVRAGRAPLGGTVSQPIKGGGVAAAAEEEDED